VTRRDRSLAKALFGNRQPLLGAFLVAALLLAGCGTPDQPKPRAAVVPAPIADLSAHQTGPSVTLSFTLPDKAIDGERLSSPPNVEIYRGFALAGAGAPDPKTAAKIYLLPGAVADTYLSGGKILFVDSLAPADLAGHTGEQAFYFVRTFTSKKHPSGDSNLASTALEPPPPPVENLAARVTQEAITLSWQPVPTGSSGALTSYHVYRALLRQRSGTVANGNASREQMESPLELLAATPDATYRDTQFEFGRTYLYSVRSVAGYKTGPVESADSESLVVTPRDTFPPAPPGGLVVVVAQGQAGLSQAELSWNSSPEADLAGYNVYRSERPRMQSERLNRDLLLVPAFRDSTVVPGHHYDYTVTAMDRAGNESMPSAAVSLEMPAKPDEIKP